MKSILLVFLITILSGCTLSQLHTVTVNSPVSTKEQDSCGALSTAIKLGARNQSILKNDDFHIQFCATVYRHRIVAAGFIVPIFPYFTDYNEVYEGVGWIQVKNLNTESSILIDSGFTDDPIVRSKTIFTFNRTNKFNMSDSADSSITLAAGETIWMGLPISDLPSIEFKSGDNSTVIDFKSSISFGWAMLTV